jgi:beta-lactam-binding protein with PASTA domain
MFKFITNKPFWVNLLAAATLGAIIVFFILQLLGWITQHGEYLTIPPVQGKNTQEAIKLLESKGFDVVIQDSIYTDTAKNGTVLKQLPEANSTVKINRTVFITVNRYVPPMIDMPALEDKSLNFALDLLARNHLKLADTIYKPHFMVGSVIEQQYNGVRIPPGAKVRWGSSITLIIGGGLDENVPVPDLIGLTYAEAKVQLDSLGILVSPAPDVDVRDTLNAFIYKQNPPQIDEDKNRTYIRSGMVMDLWLSKEMRYLTDSTETKKEN